MKKNDMTLLFLLLFAAVCAFFGVRSAQKKGDKAVIRLDGAIYAVLPLSKNTEISVNGHNTLTVSDGAVYVSSADCPDQLCKKQGKLQTTGKTLVCLPNRMTVEIETEEEK